MGTTSTNGVTLPPGSMPKIPLSGESQTVKILAADPENGYDKDGKAVASDHLNVDHAVPRRV